ncbi:hypothetical protein JIG36_20980 [Actinoplanes sp. LDG1-06]|uniref:Uncharacterized protein n=1 Tax=Paractinoplanes ovalisporus TaxID=2810368 RepID=A0ABS2ADY6_9ACTN|nr:hypothetical protein [Actinoplanes ovalisporus]MBM2618033.1 hypothetical protein [Actinoplanes ovalisporus]
MVAGVAGKLWSAGARHRNRFEQLWAAALSEGDTTRFLKGRIDDLAVG